MTEQEARGSGCGATWPPGRGPFISLWKPGMITSLLGSSFSLTKMRGRLSLPVWAAEPLKAWGSGWDRLDRSLRGA